VNSATPWERCSGRDQGCEEVGGAGVVQGAVPGGQVGQWPVLAGCEYRWRGAVLGTAAVVAFFIDLATARQLAEQAVQAARQLGDERLLSRALGALCATHFFAGEPETGRPFGQESVERARRVGDDVELAWSLNRYLMTIDPARSGRLFAEAIACTERTGDHLTNSVLHSNASIAALEAGDIPAARAHLEAAAQAAQQIGYEQASVQANLGDVLRADRDLDGARSAFEAALRIGRRNGSNWHMAPPSSAWPAWPAMRATGTGQLRCTASRKPFRTGPAVRGRNSPRVTAGTAWTKRVRTSAMSSWSEPTPRAWRSAWRRPSTWLSERRVRPDR